MGTMSIGRVQKLGHFRELRNYREFLIRALGGKYPLNKYPYAAHGAHKSNRVTYLSLCSIISWSQLESKKHMCVVDIDFVSHSHQTLECIAKEVEIQDLTLLMTT